VGLLRRIRHFVLPDLADVPRPGGEPVGGEPARAVIVETSGTYGADQGLGSRHDVKWTRKKLDVQLVADPEQRATLECHFSEPEFRAALPGAEVPVRVHAHSGAIVGFDYEAWSAEVA
jgi:hypothetical protein